jgi:hypothetical protein
MLSPYFKILKSVAHTKLNANSKRAAFWRRLGCFCYVILIGAFFFIPVEL